MRLIRCGRPVPRVEPEGGPEVVGRPIALGQPDGRPSGVLGGQSRVGGKGGRGSRDFAGPRRTTARTPFTRAPGPPMRTRLPLLAVAVAVAAPAAVAQPAPPKKATPPANVTLKEDVIYARKHGTALTLDVFTPKDKPNGRGVVLCVSGGWFSAKEFVAQAFVPLFVKPLTARGYTVFAVLHRSQPLFTIPDAAEDIDDAVKFVKKHAQEYGVDPDKLGVSGMSAGGHLSLMQGTAGGGGKVAAVGCFFPPTDFQNYGTSGASGAGTGDLKDFAAPFAFRTFDPKEKVFVPVDAEERVAITKRISPATRVSKESAPALVIHGDADKLVPLQQAELLVEKYKEAGVPFELVVKKGQAHGWAGMDKDVGLIADWFDKHLGAVKE